MLSVLVTVWHARIQLQPAQHDQSMEYTYTDDDYPWEFPVDLAHEAVAMTLHESVHFSLSASDTEARLEWENLPTWPKGFGRTRLGPQHRVFVMVFQHQHHCLWMLELALLGGSDPAASFHHINHCFNYLRQTLMCEAAYTVEMGDFLSVDYEKNKVGDTLVCRDWEKVYSVLDENHEKWVEWRAHWD
ncbi:hypothetical protein DEU56DRAFT_983745 [Suillus clintonianus]|uniref:uncharacterized protein n=1 Tax=Suillus clintonianus TaxID=1904413 RepID=UPI001B87BA7C|nr:uncharacterized protein DEU56DRAFT_983745 [Suillus clintonianus]KAG2123747.1 hypothetical protein DEU56DRAFT_983745 [Suillus clintonianus]